VILYQQDLLSIGPEEALLRGDDPEVGEFSRSLVLGVAERLPAIDPLIQDHLSGWDVARLGVLERAILRIGAYELLWEAGVPEAVVIDEAVNLAKRFCSDEAGALVNGVLGSIARAEKESIRALREVGPAGEGAIT